MAPLGLNAEPELPKSLNQLVTGLKGFEKKAQEEKVNAQYRIMTAIPAKELIGNFTKYSPDTATQ